MPAAFSVASSGDFNIRLPAWGRCFWQDPNDGELFLAYASGSTEVNFVTSSDSGVTWSVPQFAFPVENYALHSNFDTEMDRIGNIHCVFRYANSGCYQLLRKVASGGWAPSGVGPAGFVDVADTGPAKGFNGMVAVYDTALGLFGDIPGPFPAARIAAKDSGNVVNAWAVNTPFTAYPVSDDMGTSNSQNAGPSGGFPIFTDAGDFGGPQVVYQVDNTGIVQARQIFGTWSVKRTLEIRGPITPNDPLGGSGLISRLPLGPSMAFSRGTTGKLNPIVISNSFNHSSSFDWDLLTTAAEAFIIDDDPDFFGRVDSTARFQNQPLTSSGPGFAARAPNSIPFLSTMPQPVFGAPPSGGAAVDISHGDKAKRLHFYFLTRSPAGDHVISRFLCDVEAQSGGGANSRTAYTFSTLQAGNSGIRSWAPAGIVHTGGSGNIAGWNTFKALRHPVDPGVGVTKKEIVVTVGSGLSPKITSLIAWDFNNSTEAGNQLKIPTFSLERTLDSGNNPQFVGISNLVGLTQAEGLNLLDGNTSTSGAIANGDSITLEFSEVMTFSRAEIAWQHYFLSPAFFRIDIDTSLDGTTFKRVHTIDEGQTPGVSESPHLIKSSSEFEVPVDSTITDEMNAFAGKFVKLTFGGTGGGTRDVREIRLYGPHTTAGKIITDDFSKSFQQSPPLDIGRSESFGTTKEGELPLGWRVSGDWDWFVRASGDFSKKTGLPSEVAPQNGRVASGVFKGQSNGNGDGFAIRTAEWMPLNSSGILETDITVLSTETDEDGNPGRTVEWDTRWKLFGTGLLQNTPEDDSLRFFVSPSGSGITDGEIENIHLQAPCFINVCDWFTVKTNVSPGNYTLRWAFKRGNSPTVSPFPGDEAVAYVDNVFGAGGITSPSILGFLKARSFETGVIHGFALGESSGNSSINAFLSSSLTEFVINGYALGGPNAEENILGYLRGNLEGNIYGYMLGGEGLRSFPTGSINAVLAPLSGAMQIINGYLLGMKQSEIYGYLAGFSGINTGSGIFGYLKSADAAGEIYATVNAGATGINETILGTLAALANENIYGFVRAPSGQISNIYGYMSPQNQGQIFGYIASIGDATGVINSYLSVADVEGDIYGFLSASGDPLVGNQQRINGYLFNNGVSEQIYGYLNVLSSEDILGYMNGVDFASGNINAFVSGLGFYNSEINAYLAGVSGLPSGSINSYLVAVQNPSEIIYGTMIGVPIASGSLQACGNHGNIPLPTVIPAVIPSSYFNI